MAQADALEVLRKKNDWASVDEVAKELDNITRHVVGVNLKNLYSHGRAKIIRKYTISKTGIHKYLYRIKILRRKNAKTGKKRSKGKICG